MGVTKENGLPQPQVRRTFTNPLNNEILKRIGVLAASPVPYYARGNQHSQSQWHPEC